MLFAWASYVKKQDNTLLVHLPSIFVDCFENYVTIVIKNVYEDEVVFIFPDTAIYETRQSGNEELSVYIALDPDESVIYKFGFTNATDSYAFDELMNRLMRDSGATFTNTSSRPFLHPSVEDLFNRFERRVERRIPPRH